MAKVMPTCWLVTHAPPSLPIHVRIHMHFKDSRDTGGEPQEAAVVASMQQWVEDRRGTGAGAGAGASSQYEVEKMVPFISKVG